MTILKSNLSLLLVFYVNFLIYLRTTVICFNIENRDPYVKKAPDGQEGSYFGFSVALHKTEANSLSSNDNWILVGAPLGNNLQPGTNFSGALFKCPITNKTGDCVQVETDGQRLEDFDYDDNDEKTTELKQPGVDEIKNGQWLGVTVRSQKAGGLVMVCAHRYIQSPDLSKFHYGQGLCYLLDKNLKAIESLQYCKGRPTEKLHQQYGFCQIGTSMSFVGDDFALVGAPGPYTWRGTIFGQVVVGDFLDKDKTIYRGPLNDNPEPIDKYSYLGMSVGGGHFFNKNTYTYVSGAPRSQMVGQVYFFEKKQNEAINEELKIPLRITGEQFASSFGYEILVVDINNDGFDDLLVGAPFYYDNNKGGAVYIYYSLKNCLAENYNCTWDAAFYGKEQSRFGFAMTSIGDINKDGYNDVAIGAPYENGWGAVYIYLGSAKGLIKQPSQVISFNQFTTFGYSLSGGLDMDNNGYPDLLVGAYESERTFLFLTRPIVDIKIDVFSDDMYSMNISKKGCAADPLNLNNTCFSIRSCFTIVGKSQNLNEFSVEYQITEQVKIVPRIWFKNLQHIDKRAHKNDRTVVVSSYSQQYCQDEIVYIKEGVSDILSPIKFKVNYTLEDDQKHSPILNKTSVKEFAATFQKNCGDDDVCVSYLLLNAGTNMESNSLGQYTVKMADQDFILEANITNKGEPAYEAKLFVFHPTALSYVDLIAGNQNNAKFSFKNDTMVVFDLGNPFQGNASARLKIKFQIIKNTKEQKLDIFVKVNSTSKETSPATTANLVVILQKVADFSIIGKASTNLFFGGEVVGESAMRYLEDIGARVIHRYFIDNRGQWDMPDLQVIVKWPYQVRPSKEGGEGKWLLYLESEPAILGDAAGFCTVADKEKVVNPLNLDLLTTVDEPENLVWYPKESQNENNTYASDANETEALPKRRRRRDVEYVVQAQELTVNGIRRRIASMDCLLESARCADITCYIRGLKKKNLAYIEIKSRIWNSTLVEDYSDVDWVQIKSHASVEILDDTFISKPQQIFAVSAETLVYPTTIHPYSLNWWVIGGAVIAGLLLLIVLVVILYKCGFFKRKRVSKDPTLSGNLLMKDENDRLLKGK